MVTRADVARRAGTSTAVVSYVINAGPLPVAAATRQRVLQAIAELDYRPNLAAQLLRGRKSHVLGLIVPDISNPFYAELARAIEEVAERQGYTLIFGNSEQQAEREISYVRTFIDRQVDGLFLISGSSSKQLSALFADIDLPHVLLDRRINYTANAFLVATDGPAGARIATEHLLALGHTRIAALCGPAKLGTDRADGYRRTMEAAGLTAAVHHSEEFNRRSAYAAAHAILTQEQQPTAIFASNDVAGISILRAAADLGLRVPGDLAVVAFDDIQEGQYSVPRLTTVAQPIDELGRLATERLISLIGAGNPTSTTASMQLITPTLVVRESCGSMPAGRTTRRPRR